MFTSKYINNLFFGFFSSFMDFWENIRLRLRFGRFLEKAEYSASASASATDENCTFDRALLNMYTFYQTTRLY